MSRIKFNYAVSLPIFTQELLKKTKPETSNHTCGSNWIRPFKGNEAFYDHLMSLLLFKDDIFE